MLLKFPLKPHILICLVLGLLVGCGTNARNVARLELAQIVAYEEQVDKKIKAEKEFYRQTAKSIEDRFSQLTPFALSSSIINCSNQATDEMIGQPVKSITDWDIMKFVDSAIKDHQTNRAKWNEINAQIKKDFNGSVLPLDIAKQQLKEVRKKVERLQQEPSAAYHVLELQTFIAGIQVPEGQSSQISIDSTPQRE